MILPAVSISNSIPGDHMKKIYSLAIVLLLFVPALVAQEHYTEGPVWRVQLIRVKPNQMDAYLTSLRQSTKPLIEEEKRQGVIMDYKVFLKETKANPEDWDIAVAIEYKNHAAMDGLAAKGEAARDKILGGKQAAQQLGEKRTEIREIISSDLMQEIFLK
jgi:competence protein ComGC